jgi:hypothetical protein
MVYSYAYSILDKFAFLFSKVYEINIDEKDVEFTQNNLFDRKFKNADMCFKNVKNPYIYPLYSIMRKVRGKQEIKDAIKTVVFRFNQLRNTIEHRTILKIDKNALIDVLTGSLPEEMNKIIDKINEKYEYWNKVKYKQLPEGYSHEKLWTYVKASRTLGSRKVWNKYGITLHVTNRMQQMCHEFDMIFGSFWESDNEPQKSDKLHYLANSLMEEAIYSSQMEGAATTRVAAKEMLKKGISPRDKSQQMIYNNYQTILYITEHKDEPLTPESILLIHSSMTEKTLKDNNDIGRFRNENDDVVVENKITGEVVHTPPHASEIPEFINELCLFFNNSKNENSGFIHPIYAES